MPANVIEEENEIEMPSPSILPNSRQISNLNNNNNYETASTNQDIQDEQELIKGHKHKRINEEEPETAISFRLNPNISEFIGSAGVNGPMCIIKIAFARCLVQPQYQFIWLLRAIMKDEILTIIYKKVLNDLILSRNMLTFLNLYFMLQHHLGIHIAALKKKSNQL
jgi:hypothetical protein